MKDKSNSNDLVAWARSAPINLDLCPKSYEELRDGAIKWKNIHAAMCCGMDIDEGDKESHDQWIKEFLRFHTYVEREAVFMDAVNEPGWREACVALNQRILECLIGPLLKKLKKGA